VFLDSVAPKNANESFIGNINDTYKVKYIDQTRLDNGRTSPIDHGLANQEMQYSTFYS